MRAPRTPDAQAAPTAALENPQTGEQLPLPAVLLPTLLSRVARHGGVAQPQMRIQDSRQCRVFTLPLVILRYGVCLEDTGSLRPPVRDALSDLFTQTRRWMNAGCRTVWLILARNNPKEIPQ